MGDNSPIKWDDLLKYAQNARSEIPTQTGKMGTIPRKPNVQRRYGGYLNALKKRGTTINEDIIARITNNHADKKFIISKNDFPYNVEDDVAHLVLWVNPARCGGANGVICDVDSAREYVLSFVDQEVHESSLIIFENIPANRSVSAVQHFQLFVKKQYEEQLPVYKL